MEDKRIPSLPDAGFYFADFISAEEESNLLAQVQQYPFHKWTVLSHRRLLSLPAGLAGKSKDTLIDAPIPTAFAEPVISRIKAHNIFSNSPHGSPNHVLVNQYKPGEGIMPHEDGPAYYPITATISLGGHTVLEIYQKNEQGERLAEPTWRILQEPRSLLLTSGNMYKDTLHGISEVTEDRDLNADNIVNWHLLGNTRAYDGSTTERTTRVSLTYRDVLKVTKLGGAMKFMTKR